MCKLHAASKSGLRDLSSGGMGGWVLGRKKAWIRQARIGVGASSPTVQESWNVRLRRGGGAKWEGDTGYTSLWGWCSWLGMHEDAIVMSSVVQEQDCTSFRDRTTMQHWHDMDSVGDTALLYVLLLPLFLCWSWGHLPELQFPGL